MEQEPTIQSPEKADIKEIIESLRFLKEEFRDDIPKEIKHSFSSDRNWKVRKGWWQKVFGEFAKAVKYLEQSKNEKLIEDVNNFFDSYGNGFFTHRLTTVEDIQTANSLIDRVIHNLENL